MHKICRGAPPNPPRKPQTYGRNLANLRGKSAALPHLKSPAEKADKLSTRYKMAYPLVQPIQI